MNLPLEGITIPAQRFLGELSSYYLLFVKLKVMPIHLVVCTSSKAVLHD